MVGELKRFFEAGRAVLTRVRSGTGVIGVDVSVKVANLGELLVALFAGERFDAPVDVLKVSVEMALLGKGLATIPANKVLSLFMDGSHVSAEL